MMLTVNPVGIFFYKHNKKNICYRGGKHNESKTKLRKLGT